MRTLALAATFALATVSAASAGGIAFSLPSVHFPPQDATVTQACTDMTSLSETTCQPAR